MVKAVGAGAGVGLAGCLGGSGGTPTPTETQELSEMSADEWRSYVSQKAAEESGDLTLNSSSRPETWVDNMTNNPNWVGPYESLQGSVTYEQTSTSQQVSLYRQQLNAGNVTMGIMDSPQFINFRDDLEWMDLTDIPSYREAPDDVLVPPYFAAMYIKPYVNIYNTNNVSEPPTSWDDWLSPRFEGMNLVADFTPSPTAHAILLQKVGESYIEDLRDHFNVKFVKIQPNGSRMIGDGRGEFMHGVNYGNLWIDRQRGLNSDFLKFDGAIFLVPSRLTVAKGTPTPWKAKLWIDWIMGPGKRTHINNEQGGLTIDRTYSTPARLANVEAVQTGQVWQLDDLDYSPEEASDLYPQLLGYQG